MDLFYPYAVAPLITLVEMALLGAVIYAGIRSGVSSIPLALAYGIVCVVALLGSVATALLWLDLSRWSFLGDLLVLLCVAGRTRACLPVLQADIQRVLILARQNPVALGAAAVALLYLGLQAGLLPPFNNDSLAYNLARIPLCIQGGTLWPAGNTALHQLVFPPGFDAVHFWLMRWGWDFGIGIFGWLSFVGILAATYAHARLRSAPKTAALCTLVVGTLTELILMATSTKNDLPCGLLALVSLVSLSHMGEKGAAIHRFMWVVSLCFGVLVKSYFVVWVALIGGLFLWRACRREVSFPVADIKRVVPVVLCFLLLAGAWYGGVCRDHGHPFGPSDFRAGHGNRDGFVGAGANGLRYALQQFQWPSMLGGGILTTIHDAVLGQAAGKGTMAGVTVDLAGPARALLPQEDLAWYGLMSLLVVLPTGVWTLLRGRGGDRQAAWLCFGFVVFLCSAIGWSPWNGRFFALVFACSVCWIRPAIEALNTRPRLRSALVVLCICQGLFAGLLNIDKPVLDIYGFVACMEKKTGKTLLNRSGTEAEISLLVPYWVGDVVHRTRHYDSMFGSHFVSVCRTELAGQGRLAIVSRGGTILPFLTGLALPLATLAVGRDLADINLEMVDTVLLIGDPQPETIEGFVCMHTSDTARPEALRGSLWKRASRSP